MARAQRPAADLFSFSDGLYLVDQAIQRAQSVRAMARGTRARSAFLRHEARRLALESKGRSVEAQVLRRQVTAG
jgi:hypothetical protein